MTQLAGGHHVHGSGPEEATSRTQAVFGGGIPVGCATGRPQDLPRKCFIATLAAFSRFERLFKARGMADGAEWAARAQQRLVQRYDDLIGS